MPKKTSKQTAMTKTSDDTALAVVHDELADVLGDEKLETDGLEELGSEDIKIASKVFNMKGMDANGDPIMPNVFFDTVTEETQKEIDGTLLTLVKSNAWAEYDEATLRNKTICRSADRETGTMLETGEQRACKGCPDAQWRNVEGKRTRKCGPVYTLIGVERLTQQPFVLRCKRTSLAPFQQYLNRYFVGRRVVKGKRSNYPLFSFGTTVTLEMDDGGQYSTPKFTRGDVLTRDELRSCANQAKFYREVIMPIMDKIDQAEENAGSSGSPSEPTAAQDDFLDDAPPAPQPADKDAVPF